MFNLFFQALKTKILPIATKISIKDITLKIKEVLTKMDKKSKEKKVTSLVKEVAPTAKMNKEPKWQKYFPFSFCYGGGKFQPIYFFVTLFCFLAAAMLYTKIHAASVAIKSGTFTSDMISTADLGVVLGFVSSLILLYNSNKKSYNKPSVEPAEKETEGEGK